jgi:hypothetical protein
MNTKSNSSTSQQPPSPTIGSFVFVDLDGTLGVAQVTAITHRPDPVYKSLTYTLFCLEHWSGDPVPCAVHGPGTFWVHDFECKVLV